MFRETVFTSGARFYAVAAQMVALILTARWLGPEGRGTAVVLITWVNLFASIGYLSLGQVCVHRAGVEGDLTWLSEAVGALFVMTGIATLVGWTCAYFMWAHGSEALLAGSDLSLLLIAFAALPFLVWEQYNSALLSVVGRLKLYNIMQLVGRTLTLALLLLTILVLDWGVHGFLVATLAGQVVISMAGAGVLFAQAGRRIKTSIRTIVGLVTNGLKLHLNAIGVLLFSSVDILMIQWFLGPAEAGIFQFASQIFLALLIVPQAALLVLNSRVRTLDRPAFWRVHKRMIFVIMAVMTGGAAMLALLAAPIIPLIATEAFAPSVPVLQILCIGVVAATLNTMMGLQWILRGLFLQSSMLTLAAGLLNCLLNLFLIPKFGAAGAAWATVAGVYLIPFTANLLLMRRINSLGSAT